MLDSRGGRCRPETRPADALGGATGVASENGLRSQHKGMQWACDIFDQLIADVLKSVRELVANLLEDRMRDADPVGPGQTLEPCRDIDAIAKNVLRFGDDVADIEADAEGQLTVLWNAGIAKTHPALNFDCAHHRLNRAGEFREHSVAGRFDDPSSMLPYPRDEQLPEVGLVMLMGALFVDPHQARVAGDIGSENRHETAAGGLNLRAPCPM